MADESTIPTLLERAQVSAHFPLFRNAAALAHLAHIGTGPPYIIVGGKAWYELGDIKAWLEANKKRGPTPENDKPASSIPPIAVPKRRGRPTKFEQFHRQLRSPAEKTS
jgi:hypothetical protein